MLSVKSLSLSLVVCVIGIVLYSVCYDSTFVDEFIEKSFADKTRNNSLQEEENMTSIFQKISQNVLLKAPAGPVSTKVYNCSNLMILIVRGFFSIFGP